MCWILLSSSKVSRSNLNTSTNDTNSPISCVKQKLTSAWVRYLLRYRCPSRLPAAIAPWSGCWHAYWEHRDPVWAWTSSSEEGKYLLVWEESCLLASGAAEGLPALVLLLLWLTCSFMSTRCSRCQESKGLPLGKSRDFQLEMKKLIEKQMNCKTSVWPSCKQQ